MRLMFRVELEDYSATQGATNINENQTWVISLEAKFSDH